MADIAACLSTGKDDWETPDDLFERYNQRYNFILDAAANGHNRKCSRWFGDGGVFPDALSCNWPLDEGNIWLNPPYSRGLQAKFVRKAAAEVDRCWQEYGVEQQFGNVVLLLPARTDTKLFHDVIQARCSDCMPRASVEFLKGRVKFKGAAQGAPFPSMVVIF